MDYKYYEKFDEHVYKKTLDNGLRVYLIPKNDYHKTFVSFVTNYGGNDLTFIPLGKSKKVTQPAGIAHFLEHKLFKNKDGSDAFEQLSNYGVNANAYTTNDKTAYIFSGTENINEALEYLIDFVQEPYFSKKNVEKEKGIITEEINMYFEYPYVKLLKGLMNNTYKNHPLKNDVIGSIESINKITPYTLYQAYETFYHPSNMYIVISGNFNVNQVMEIIKGNQAKKSYVKSSKIQSFFPYEPRKVVNKSGSEEASISMPYAGISVKLEPEEDLSKQLKKALVLDIVLEYFYSNSGIEYEELLRKGLVNSSFETNVFSVKNALSCQIVSYTNDPEEFISLVTKSLANFKRRKLDDARINTLKRSSYGSLIKNLNNVEEIVISFVEAIPFGVDFFEVIDLIKDITIKDIEELLMEIKSDVITSYTLIPKKV